MPKPPSPKPRQLTSPETQSSNNKSQTASVERPFLDANVMGHILETLNGAYDLHPMGELTRNNPYKVLVACVLSLRTKDEVMIPASERLFVVADTPEKMVRLAPETIEKLVYPVGFYKTKAQSIIDFSQKLLDEFGGQVPNTIDELLTLKGVGRKTANLVVGLGHGLPAICVDTHVHRICNRLGYLQTKTPEETEMVLRNKLPQPYWSVINTVMVLHGQQTCKPIGPRCDVCPVETLCQKVDVKPRALKKLKPAK
ncbi:MAG: endonuclease [Vampirovibrio sp.]|nr:endonuclease [Vampirovibrio sp.]